MQAKKIILWLYYFSLGLLLISLPFSNYTMSISQFMLVGVFILDGVRKKTVDEFLKRHGPAGRILLCIPYSLLWIADALGRKFRAFFYRENISAWIFASIYLVHLIGLIYTSDLHYAMKDMRVKFPLFLLPLILSTTGIIDRKVFRYFVMLFISAVFTGTLISTVVFLQGRFTDVREISLFISHIRFSLLIDLAIFQSFYLLLSRHEDPFWLKATFGLAGMWMAAFLVLFGFLTGLVILLVTGIIFLLIYAFVHQGRPFRLAAIPGLALILLGAAWYILNIYKDVNTIHPVDFKSLSYVTSRGNYYYHDTTSTQVENGNYVWLYINEEEMRDVWNRRSTLDYEGKDRSGQGIKYTLMRFLTSKGLRKDADGVEKLTDEEVRWIENGTASIVYAEKPLLYVRIYKIFWEYNRYMATRDASGHSLMQRIEYWRTALGIVRDHRSWLAGIGTGDLNQAFAAQYERMGTKLQKEFRWRTHNQFLAIFVTFGAIGLAWFLFCLIFPAAHLRKFGDYYYLTFLLIFMLSMLTEDTLETQAGATQFAFFTSFYLFLKKFVDPY